jgi:hypothetical protein
MGLEDLTSEYRPTQPTNIDRALKSGRDRRLLAHPIPFYLV